MNYEKEIRNLNKDATLLLKKYEEKTKEIKRLTKRLEESQLAFLQVDKERNRLNNIINELEEYLNKVIQTSTGQERITCSFVLQYLQELKGEDKE